MFNNYQELYYGYIDFYTTSWYGPGAGISLGGHANAPNPPTDTQSHTSPNQIDHRVSIESTSVPLGVYDKHLKTVRDNDNVFRDNCRLASIDDAIYLGSSNNSGCAKYYSPSTTTTASGQSSASITSDQSEPDHNGMITLTSHLSGGKLVRIGSFNALDTIDMVHLASVFILLLLAKRYLCRKLSQSKRIEHLGLRQKDRERLDECIWRMLFYSFSSTWLIYSCLKQNSHLLLTTNSWSVSSSSSSLKYTFELDWSSYAIFIIEAAFYLHATYALLVEDVWRRDSPMMLIHHLAAAFTTISIYATRTHQIGLVSTVLRDTCDVLLEMTKLIKCLHIQHGKRVRSLGMTVNCLLAIFASAFAVNQLYYYPLYCLYHGLNMIKLCALQTPTMVAILTCGLIFLLLDFLWFTLILRLLYYMLISGKSVKDIREYDDEDEDIVDGSDDNNQLAAETVPDGSRKKSD